MSDENSRSPYEQGELESSPEITREKQSKRKERQASFSPEQNETLQPIVIDRDSEDDTLDIKPPQSQSGKRSHKHKHKDDRRRERDRRQDRERERDHGRDRERNRVGHVERHRMPEIRSDRSERPQDRIRDKRDYRERERAFERERFEETREEREVRESKKREQSQLERERLEEKERQKQREIRIREDRQRKEEREKRKMEEKRSQNSRQERSKARPDIRYRSRSREGHRKRNPERRDERIPREDKSNRRKGPRTPEEVYVEEEIKEENVVIDIDPMSSEPEHEEQVQSDSVAESESESDSESDSSSASSEEESPASKQEDEEEADASDHTPGAKMKSKFDEHSGHESGNESVSDNENRAYIEESPPASPIEEEVKLPPYLPAIQGCRSVEEFRCLNRIEEGTYGVVYRAKDKKNDEIVALKRLKMEKEKEGFPITSLREINTLLKAQHPNIVTVREIVVGSNMDKIYIVMDYVEHDLKSLMEVMKSPFSIGETKTLMKQLLRAVSHLHDNWILHRDLKTSNLLFSHKGVLKVGDFGLAREYGSPLKQYTPIVVTLWYRAPELLLGCKEYSTAIDMWSVGCIFAEFLTMKPLWPGKSEIDELNRIFKDLGTPNEKIWPGVSELPGMKKCNFAEHPYNAIRNRFGAYLSDLGFDLLNRFLTYSPSRRISAEEALNHKYFEESPLPVDPSMFPTWPAKSEQPRKHISSPKPPSGGKAYSRLVSEECDLGFHMSTAAKGASAVGNPGFTLKF